MNENLNGRAKTLYEQNNNSPLFLKTADYYISENEIQKAILILEAGLKFFPDHPLAFVLMGKANYLMGNLQLADSFFKRASELLDSNRTYLHYKKELNLPDKQVSPFDNSRGSIFINSFEDDNLEEINTKLTDGNESIDDRLSQLAKEVMNARIERNDNFSIPDSNRNNFSIDRSQLATETLADIYLAQGEKGEAIKIFNLLIQRNPEKKEYYLERISEINSG